MTFDSGILKLETDKGMKTKKKKKKNLKTLANTQNPLKTSLINLILSNPVVLEPTLNASLIDFNEVS